MYRDLTEGWLKEDSISDFQGEVDFHPYSFKISVGGRPERISRVKTSDETGWSSCMNDDSPDIRQVSCQTWFSED